MLNAVIYSVLLVISLFFLIKSSDYFTDSSSQLGSKLGLSSLVVGIVIVSVGTSLPELVTAIIAIYSSSAPSSFILGNVMGSNIANVCLVFGFLLFLTKQRMKLKLHKRDLMGLSFLTLVLLAFSLSGTITRIAGIIMVLAYSAYIYFNLGEAKEEGQVKTEKSYLKILGMLLLSGGVLYLSAKGVVTSVEVLARLINIPVSVITLSTVAIGTSLPELFVTISAVKKKVYNIAFGNVIGSNIANIGIIVGISSIFKPLSFNMEMFFFSLVIMVVTTGYLIILSMKKNRRITGLLLILFYLYYLITLFIK